MKRPGLGHRGALGRGRGRHPSPLGLAGGPAWEPVLRKPGRCCERQQGAAGTELRWGQRGEGSSVAWGAGGLVLLFKGES